MDFTEEDLIEMKRKVKQMEKELREKNKPKTITIPGKTHSTIKKYCSELNLNIGEWASQVLLREIENDSCVIKLDDDYDTRTKKLAEEIKQKYNVKRSAFKLDKIFIHKDLKSLGYSRVDAYPIYEYTGDNINEFTEKYKENILNIFNLDNDDISEIPLNEDLDVVIPYVGGDIPWQQSILKDIENLTKKNSQ